MAKNDSYLKISFLQLIVVIVLLSAFIVGGFLLNQVRTQDKLESIKGHVERVYTAHRFEIINTLKSNVQVYENNLLAQINEPEKGVYQISFLIKDSNGGYRLQNRWLSGSGSLSLEELNRLKEVLSEDKSTATDTNIFNGTQSQDKYLYSFTPIKDEDSTVMGYLMLSVRKKQNL